MIKLVAMKLGLTTECAYGMHSVKFQSGNKKALDAWILLKNISIIDIIYNPN